MYIDTNISAISSYRKGGAGDDIPSFNPNRREKKGTYGKGLVGDPEEYNKPLTPERLKKKESVGSVIEEDSSEEKKSCGCSSAQVCEKCIASSGSELFEFDSGAEWTSLGKKPPEELETPSTVYWDEVENQPRDITMLDEDPADDPMINAAIESSFSEEIESSSREEFGHGEEEDVPDIFESAYENDLAVTPEDYDEDDDDIEDVYSQMDEPIYLPEEDPTVPSDVQREYDRDTKTRRELNEFNSTELFSSAPLGLELKAETSESSSEEKKEEFESAEIEKAISEACGDATPREKKK